MEKTAVSEDNFDARQVSIRLHDGQELLIGKISGKGAIVITRTLDLADAGSESRHVWQAHARTHIDSDVWDNRPA